MAKYKAYPEYKDSGVEWIGKIPSHWEVASLSKLFSIKAGGDVQQSLFSEVCSDEYPYPIYTNANDEFAVYGYTKKANYQSNTITVSGRGDVGFAVYRNHAYDAIIRLLVLAPLKQLECKFYSYFINSVIDFKVESSAIGQLSTQQISPYKSVIPSRVEQRNITTFLDYETAKIDNLIEKQQQLIELLKEKRQAVISHAVTKGLNPDVPMKDSGVEWLGELPNHWQALPTKRLFRLVAEPAEINNDYELLSVYTAIGVAPRKDLEPKGNKASTTDGYWKVRQGDIIVNKLLAWMGAVGFSNYDGVTSPAYDILRKVKDINPKFYHYLFRLELTQREFKRWSRGIMEMRLRLYFEELGRIIMPVPPRQEQDVIVEEIEKIEHQYSQLENIASHQIDLLQERRTALISAAVTGKIDVRDWVAPDKQDVEEPQEAIA
ncbi:restriction endonuclease subunit S [Enterobacter asburiae]|uniref:restriction endonuclease subunit S n=1 Tax=Enterobacter asburiae TaxID=61645 RepID=UPI0029D761C6|nr:restriction endonuclease subunit S [Enterobacter asburiae]MDX7663838.1 restriction endonuclease subunit S [Enterobacter asburiae]